MEVETWREAWWSSTKIPLSLEKEEWIQKSYQDAPSFWASLTALQAKMAPRLPKSERGEKYDFYYDCVLRHVEANPALFFIDEIGSIQSWTYKKIHRATNFQVKEWLKRGVKSGQLVVLAFPIGIGFFIALLTALRLGLVISYLPLGSPIMSEKHLSSVASQLQPAWIVTSNKDDCPLLHRYPRLAMESLGEDEQSYDPPSWAYAAKMPMQYSLSLHLESSLSVVSLDAETTYLHALRDGLLTLNLQPGTTWASPLSCPIRTQPCSILSAFLSGSTFLHIEEKALENDPNLLKNEKLHLLGISPSLQKILSQHPLSLGKQLKGYYKSPLTHHTSSWKTFVQTNNLEAVPSFHLLMDNSFGGSLLFSRPSLEELTVFCKPSLALPWKLNDLNGSGEASLLGMGYFNPQNEQHTNFLAAQIENDLVINSASKPCKEGVTIPIEKIEKAISQLPFVENCMLHCHLKMGEVASYQTVLLVFTHPLKNSVAEKTKEEWTEAIRYQISHEIGPVFLPDRIEFYPLIPPLKNGQIDRDRCSEQFSKGLLRKKRGSQTYQLLSVLKKFAQEANKTKDKSLLASLDD